MTLVYSSERFCRVEPIAFNAAANVSFPPTLSFLILVLKERLAVPL